MAPWRGAFIAIAALTLPSGIVAGGAALSGTFVVDTRTVHPDFDQDGLPDNYEQQVGLNWQTHDSDHDPDRDGRSNLQEYHAGSNPIAGDWPGMDRAISRLFPLDTGGFARPRDADFDGLPDWWERLFFTNTLEAVRWDDSDGDRHDNWQEFLAGTDPVDHQSALSILEVRPGQNSVVRWLSVPNRAYTVWRSTSPTLQFEAMASNLVATPPINSFTNVNPGPFELYRLSTVPE